MASKRVLMISYHTCPLASEEGKETGGMNVYVLEMAKELGKLGYEIDIITRIQDTTSEIEVQITDSVRLVHLAAGPAAHVNKRKLLTHIPEFVNSFLEQRSRDKKQYDIVDAHYYQSGLIGLELQKYISPRAPLVMTFHTLGLMKNLVARDTSEQESSERLDAEFLLSKQADAIVTPSWSEKEYMKALYEVDDAKLHQIPPAVNTHLFQPKDRDVAKKKIGAGVNDRILLFVGRIEPLKGIDMILYALKIFLSRHPDEQVCLVIVGGDVSQQVHERSPVMRRLVELRQRLKIPANVTFVGQQPQHMLPYFYNAAELVIMPSHYESFGMAAAESMACGTPVITTNASGISYLIDEKRSNLITSVNNPLLLTSQIEKLLLDRNAHASAARLARLYVERLRWDVSARKVDEMYTLISR